MVLHVRRTYCVNSTRLCVHKLMNKLRSPAVISMLFCNAPLKFSAPALEELAMLEIISMQHRVTFEVTQL